MSKQTNYVRFRFSHFFALKTKLLYSGAFCEIKVDRILLRNNIEKIQSLQECNFFYSFGNITLFFLLKDVKTARSIFRSLKCEIHSSKNLE